MYEPSPRPQPRSRPRPQPSSRPGPQPRSRPRPYPAAPTPPAPPAETAQAVDDEPRRLTFGPEWRTTFIAVPGAGFAALVAFLADEPVQKLFAVLVVLALLLVAAADVCFSPRLTVTEEGLRVHGPFDRARLAWSEIETIQASSSTRFGLRSPLLEISAGERLIVLDKKDLAADPWAVVNKIADFRARSATR